MLLVTTAMKPLSDLTTPRKLIALISRHFLPVEQPDPSWCTTGLKKGSRLPFIAHFFSSALGLAASGLVAGGAETATAADVLAAAAAFASFFTSGFGAAAFATATLLSGTAFATAGFAEGALAGVGAGALLATTGAPPWVCRIRVTFPAGPGATSYARAFSRSTTTLVVGGFLPSMPMRTPFTPPLPTGILFWALATTVSGSSTNTRAGELNLVTRGVTAWLELISIWMSSLPGTTLTCVNWLFAPEAGSAFGAAAFTAGLGVGAAAVA